MKLNFCCGLASLSLVCVSCPAPRSLGDGWPGVTRVRVGLPFAGNYPGDRRFASTGWLCRCGSREQEEHIRGGEYPVYSDIRREYDCLEEDEEL